MDKRELELREENLSLREKELELKIQLFELRAPKTIVKYKSYTRTTVANIFLSLLFVSAIATISIPLIYAYALSAYFWLIIAQLTMFIYLHQMAIGNIKKWVNKWSEFKKRGIERAKEHEQKRKAKV